MIWFILVEFAPFLISLYLFIQEGSIFPEKSNEGNMFM